MTVRVLGSSLVFGFGSSEFKVSLHRTIRLPESGQRHGLPPGHGGFPVKRVQDYQDRVPKKWLEHGGVLMPMYEREALWLGFYSNRGVPHAVKVAAGKVNAVNGQLWSNDLMSIDQDHMVSPPQPWLDGFKMAPGGSVRQFVATALGSGDTVEGQVTGKEEFGGIQIMVVPPKYVPPPPKTVSHSMFRSSSYYSGDLKIIGSSCSLNSSQPRETSYMVNSEMGLGAGAEITQTIHSTGYPIDHWNQDARIRTYIHFVSPAMWEEITGEKAPAPPAEAHQVAQPYYNGYVPGGAQGNLVSDTPLDKVETLGQKDFKKGVVKQDDSPIEAKPEWLYKPTNTVGDGKW